MPRINQEEYEVLKELDDKWKWIARDRGDSLFAFELKPFKDNCAWLWRGDSDFSRINKSGFQFIQWEDEEPYNIAKLIEEYEEGVDLKGQMSVAMDRLEEKCGIAMKEIRRVFGGSGLESEETEVKDIEWLRNEIKKLQVYTNNPMFGKFDQIRLWDVEELINQLDEPEVLSQEWIDKNKRPWTNLQGTKDYIAVSKIQNLLVPKQEITEEQVTEYLRERSMTAVDSTLVHRENLVSKIVTEIPTIPEFVAEFLEGREGYALYELFDDEWLYDNHDELARWLYDNDEKTNRERELNLVLAQRVGYEVETEQRYYVMNNDDRMMLVRMMDGKTITEADPFKLEDMYEAEKKAHRLTEKEIKDYDERYFAFAKPVEEVEG